MRRMTFDALVSAAGLLLVGVLLVAGGLLAWTSSYINNEVSTQLSPRRSPSRPPIAQPSRRRSSRPCASTAVNS